MKNKTLHMIGNAHIDPVWLWQWPEGFHEVLATFRSALDRLTEDPQFIFTASSAAFYEWVEQVDPAIFEEIRQRVAEGRWQLAGGWWIEPDCNIPAGESLVRQGLYGQRFFKDRFGTIARVGYNPDSFGHSAMLPQILKKSGLLGYVFLRPSSHEKGLPGDLFWWESDDGSRVLAFRIPFEYCSWPADIERHVRRVAAQVKPPLNQTLCFFGVGNHGGGPTRENLACIHRLETDPELPHLVLDGPNALLQWAGGEASAMEAKPVGQQGRPNAETGHRFAVAEARSFAEGSPASTLDGRPAQDDAENVTRAHTKTSQPGIPVVHSDLQHHASGCYAAHSGVKRWNRQAENALLVAEKWSAVASGLTGRPYPATELTRAWKNVLFNQFHDIMAGTSIEPAYEDARNAYGEALSIAGRALNSALQSIGWNIGIEQQDGVRPLVVFNPHAWPARVPAEVEFGRLEPEEILVDDEGRPVPFQALQSAASTRGRQRLSFMADLPPLGYRVYRVMPGDFNKGEGLGVRADGPTLERGIPENCRAVAAGAAPGADPPRLRRGGRGSGLSSREVVDRRPGLKRDADTLPVYSLESGNLRLEINPETGCIKTLFDKRYNTQVFLGEAARPVVIDDPSDTWSHNVYRYDRVAGTFIPRRVCLAENGPVRATLRVESDYHHSSLTQAFTLYRDLDRVDVAVTVDWHEHNQVLKLRFPANIAFQRVTYEVPYGHIERFANGDEDPGQSWVDVSGESRDTNEAYGVSILNDGKYSFDVNLRDIGLTVLRSPIYAHHIPYVPQAEGYYTYMDQGLQRFTYAILPHAGGWESAGTVQRAAELNQLPAVLPATFHPQGRLPQRSAFLSVDRDNIVVTVLKQAEDGPEDLVLRAYETSGASTRARICLDSWGRVIEVDFAPCEIKTFRIPRDSRLPVTETNLLEWVE